MTKGEPAVPKTFYKRRHKLFSKYDEGIFISEKMWYSVTPESVATAIAERVGTLYPEVSGVIDVCAGAGGNTIGFATAGYNTTAIDIDPSVLMDASNNCAVYGIHNVTFYACDATAIDLAEAAVKDGSDKTLVFSSPEWGGPNYKNAKVFNVDECNPPVSELVAQCQNQGMGRIGIYLPRTSDLNQLAELGATQIDYWFSDHWCVALTAWWFVPE